MLSTIEWPINFKKITFSSPDTKKNTTKRTKAFRSVLSSYKTFVKSWCIVKKPLGDSIWGRGEIVAEFSMTDWRPRARLLEKDAGWCLWRVFHLLLRACPVQSIHSSSTTKVPWNILIYFRFLEPCLNFQLSLSIGWRTYVRTYLSKELDAIVLPSGEMATELAPSIPLEGKAIGFPLPTIQRHIEPSPDPDIIHWPLGEKVIEVIQDVWPLNCVSGLENSPFLGPWLWLFHLWIPSPTYLPKVTSRQPPTRRCCYICSHMVHRLIPVYLHPKSSLVYQLLRQRRHAPH